MLIKVEKNTYIVLCFTSNYPVISNPLSEQHENEAEIRSGFVFVFFDFYVYILLEHLSHCMGVSKYLLKTWNKHEKKIISFLAISFPVNFDALFQTKQKLRQLIISKNTRNFFLSPWHNWAILRSCFLLVPAAKRGTSLVFICVEVLSHLM